MAYRESIQNEELKSNLTGASFFWNLHRNVGYGCKNYRSDVRLVQFLLNAQLRSPLSFLSGVPPLDEDGQFGGKTWARIKKFQSVRLYIDGRGEVNMSADGMVSSTNGRKFLTSNTKTIYTILTLNVAYHSAYPQFFKDISRDPNITPPLKEALTGMPSVA